MDLNNYSCIQLICTVFYLQGFDIFSGVADAYESVCNATKNLHLSWEKMIHVLDSSSEFMKRDDSFSPYSGVIDTVRLLSLFCLSE